jgi:HSP20 family protein
MYRMNGCNGFGSMPRGAVRVMPLGACGSPTLSNAAAEILKAAFGAPSDAARSAENCTEERCASERPTYRLPIDLHEERRDGNGAWVITASVPGFAKQEVSIEVKDGVLTIAATRATARDEVSSPESVAEATPQRTLWRRERREVNLFRQIRLPENASDAGITAALADGVLTVTIPQVPEAQPRKVDIA